MSVLNHYWYQVQNFGNTSISTSHDLSKTFDEESFSGISYQTITSGRGDSEVDFDANQFMSSTFEAADDNVGADVLTDLSTNNILGCEENLIKIVPPKKCLMPKKLMSFYNCYQRLDVSNMLGKPHLVNSVSSTNKM